MTVSSPNTVNFRKAASIAAAALYLVQITATSAGAYALGTTVADMRQPASRSGGTSCPQLTRHDASHSGSINRQWSTALSGSPVSILTADQTSTGRLNELESVIQQSFAVWTGVPGALLKPNSLGTLQRTSVAAACSSTDGINSICFNQNDAAFAVGVLAFTRVVTADTIGEQLSPSTPPSAFIGQILDADVLLRPADTTTKFATPAALPANLNAYDLQSILTHELGHFFGFDHSGSWSAIMFPFAPPPGQWTGLRPTVQVPDAPLSDDDRTGLRVLYPDPADITHTGAIRGRVLPANSLTLPVLPSGVTGIFPAQVVAVNQASGNVIAAVFAGWSCSGSGPAQFDGSYALERLAVGASQGYQVYAEPLDGPVTLGNTLYSLTALSRNSATDIGWPSQFACTAPAETAPFSAATRRVP